ncbi:putative G-protein coupled receptor 33 [Pteropus medius]|uniref:Probable G-protein coupled receptor 33 n=1 Tax=Pteropus vampyrus TaxID=132908 RepID=A0A6P6BPF7_PTEVA|nr:probable G-protein coupled receptor 33 [Pteropus vampyrus]XP_039726467.1 probable G-protein coupled receptor 33 [Pteropus giganteus]XP_039726468.1 probable G-protein coupled receptor 33 [Pteropus giganteus]
MDLINATDYLLSVSTLVRNSTHLPAPASKMIIVILLFMSATIGTITNGLYLWVLKFKMKKTVNTLFFFHLILSYFISTLILPFIATSSLQDNHWSFGTTTCKIFNSILSTVMFASIFFLSAISVDRYLLTLHPVWSQLHRTPRWASSIILGVWISAIALGLPYLVFRETHEDHKGMVICRNNYAVSSNWESKKIQTLRKWIHVAFFIGRFLLGFLLPFSIISFCYGRVANKMKSRGLFKSNKPLKVIMTAIISFFVCWMPYHVYQGLILIGNQSLLLKLTAILTVISIFFNTVFSPTLYLFIGENFKKIFKKSILALFESTFSEDSSAERTENLNSEGYI